MSDQVCVFGPYEMEMKVGIINDKGDTGTVTFGFGHGTTPTLEDIDRGLAASAEAINDKGFRLMNRHEYLTEQIGHRVAVPGPKEFADARAKAGA